MFHPLLRIACRAGLHELASRPDLDDAAAETLDRFDADERGSYRALVGELAERRHTMPAEGRLALEAPHAPDQPHPFLDWLTHGGAAWLYSIAQIVAAMFGWRLPPLPPLPPAP